MAFDKQKWFDDSVEIQKRKKQIKSLGEARRSEEQALVVEYKIDECNVKRAEIQSRYQAQLNALSTQISDIESTIGEI